MKNDDPQALIEGIRQMLAGPLADADSILLADTAVQGGEPAGGSHFHDTWELFCPLRGALRFAVVGRPATAIPAGRLLIVPPGCLHMGVDRLVQPPQLKLLVMNLPGKENPCGGISVRDRNVACHTVLSEADLATWTVRAGGAPATVLETVAQALAEGPWGRERALGLLRVLVAAYAEIATRPRRERALRGASRAAEAQLYLQTHYDDPGLSLANVAAAVGCSPSHLGVLFRKATGRSVHRTLLDIRLRRATDLLARGSFSVKEVAALTGWSNQLYFSAAYRRRWGKPPSAVRRSL